MMKVLTEKSINHHFDKAAERVKGTAMPDAIERLLAKNEKERQEALAQFKQDGYIEVREIGQQWEIKRKNSEAKIRANDRYNKTHTKNVAVRFNINTDADIIAHLETVDNKSEYFKRLIREDMAK